MEDFLALLNKNGYFTDKLIEARKAYGANNWIAAKSLYNDLIENYEKTAIDEEDKRLGIPGLSIFWVYISVTLEMLTICACINDFQLYQQMLDKLFRLYNKYAVNSFDFIGRWYELYNEFAKASFPNQSGTLAAKNDYALYKKSLAFYLLNCGKTNEAKQSIQEGLNYAVLEQTKQQLKALNNMIDSEKPVNIEDNKYNGKIEDVIYNPKKNLMLSTIIVFLMIVGSILLFKFISILPIKIISIIAYNIILSLIYRKLQKK